MNISVIQPVLLNLFGAPGKLHKLYLPDWSLCTNSPKASDNIIRNFSLRTDIFGSGSWIQAFLYLVVKNFFYF